MNLLTRWTVFAGILLVGCGGGGSSGGGNSPPPPPPSASTPVISTQPSAATVANGAAASFTVAATGNGTLSYAWRKDSIAIPGATAATYAIASASAASAGNYDVVVTNTLNGTATATSSAAVLTVVLPPTITQQPTPVTTMEGGSASLSVSATAAGAVSYQWRKGGVAIPGATQASYATNAASASQSGDYDVVVTNTQNSIAVPVTSNAVALSVLTQPVISAEGAVVSGSVGHVASILAQPPGVTYAWKLRNGTITAGQGTNQITYTAGSLGDAQLVVTLGGGTLSAVKQQRIVSVSPAATLFAPPVVHPMDADIRASGSAIAGYGYNFSASAGVASTADPSAQPWAYQSAGSTGNYSLDVTVTDSHSNVRSLSRTLSIAKNVFLRHKRDPIPRSLHTATLLNDGRVLIVGGDGGVADYGTLGPQAGTQSRVLGSAELFDPVTENFADTPSISPRYGHTATLLNDGRVLVVGGASAASTYLGSVTIYDPDTRTWSATGSLNVARAMHTATLLTDGRVLVTGGVGGSGALASTELYDPAGGSWSITGAMGTARVLHAVTRLNDGRVFVAGGRNGGGLLSSVEIFDPAAGTWSAAASLGEGVNGFGAVTLPDGRVVMSPRAIYDPALDKWSGLPSPGQLDDLTGATLILAPDGSVVASGSPFSPRLMTRYSFVTASTVPVAGSVQAARNSTATLLADGRILVIGGTQGNDGLAVPDQQLAQGKAFALDVIHNLINRLGSDAPRGANGVAGTLPSGRVLFAGGADARIPTATVATSLATLFDPSSNLFLPISNMPTARVFAASAVLGNGRMLVAGGTNGFIGVHSSADYYDPAANAWSGAGTMSVARFRHTLSVLPNGGAIAVGGRNVTSCSCTTFLSSVDRYDPTTNSWSPASPIGTARDSHTATVLADGRVLIVGGYGGATNTLADTGTPLASAEIFDAGTGNWGNTDPLNTARRDHVAIRLADGRVLVAGGSNGTTALASAEIYDPNTGHWTAAAPMNVPRQSASIAMLPDGRVLVANGLNGASSAVFGTGTAEAYDPVANVWSTPVPVTVPRTGERAVSLADGRVMIVGGLPNYAGAPEFYR